MMENFIREIIDDFLLRREKKILEKVGRVFFIAVVHVSFMR